MGKKRENGEGSFYQLKNKSWQYRIRVGYDQNGGIQRKTFYGKTKTECKNKADEIYKKVEEREAVYKDSKIAEWGVDWLFTYKKDTVSPNTYRGYEHMMKHITDSFLGRMALIEVKPIHIRKFLSSKKEYSHSFLTKVKR